MPKLIHGAALLLIRNDKTILMQHRDNNPQVTYADHWGYPAGRVEEGEEFVDAARRELTEETGYVPKEVFPLLEENYERYDGQIIRRHIFWTRYDGIQKILCNEGQEMRFMSLDDISKEKLLPGQLKVIQKALRQAFPDSTPNAIILHGTGTKKDDFWFPYLKNELEKIGYKVWLPELPNDEYPNLKEWLPLILSKGKFTEETLLIGHSAGAQVILSVLENINVIVKKAILVSGYAKTLRKDIESGKNEDEPHWDDIKSHAAEFIFINSDNDPWGCDDKQGKIMAEKLGGKLIIRHDGHMGSTTHNQPYKEFPLLLELVK